MPSTALGRWIGNSQDALDEIETAHHAVGGKGRGRRYATLQVNHAYATLLSSQFQRFCRDLHSEAVDFCVGSVTPAPVRPVVRAALVLNRKLDQGNPNPGNLGSDFGRLGMQFWPKVNGLDRRNPARQARLEKLNEWRNAIAHQDWSKLAPELRLAQVQDWRSACQGLAASFDAAVGAHLGGLVGTPPW